MSVQPPPMTRIALELAHSAYKRTGEDPRMAFVTLMTAAAIAGHILEQKPEVMHATLDKVMDVAAAALSHATETKQ